MHLSSSFTPLSALAGGALIGLSASILWWTHGRVAGVSGLLGGLVDRDGADRDERPWFLLGLVAAGALLLVARPSAFPSAHAPLAVTAVAGLLVGVGTRLGSGCTSGHGVCGLSRLSPRSLASTLTFLATGAATVLAVRLLGGGS